MRYTPYPTVQKPPWAGNWFAASQEIPRISRNQKFHYRTHKRPPTASILGHPNPAHIPTSHLFTYLLTHSIVHSPSWAANWFAASQEIPRISRNPKVHYRTHNRPPPLHATIYSLYYICKSLYIFPVVSLPIMTTSYQCIYSNTDLTSTDKYTPRPHLNQFKTSYFHVR